MFTGIVQALAPVVAAEKNNTLLHYGIEFPSSLLEGLEIGASVAVDGTCQTVVRIETATNTVWFDAIEETLTRTTFEDLKVGRRVNIERSARFGDEIGGHLLSGHIFGTAKLEKISHNIYTFSCPIDWTKYLFEKGFIAIDGASLTLVEVDSNSGFFTVHLIPETLSHTTLGFKKPGDSVNLEIDAMTQATVTTIERFLKK